MKEAGFIHYKNSLLKNISGTILIKGFTILLSFILTPSFIKYFNNMIILGLWFTLISILNWVFSFDLGIGNGLRNNLTKAVVTNNQTEIKELISTAYILLGILSFFIFIIGWILIDHLNWNIILSINKEIITYSILLRTVRIVFFGIVVQLFLKIIISILYAIQWNIFANALSLITNIILLIFLLFCKTDNISDNMINLAFIHVIATILPLFAASVYVFITVLKDVKPNIHNYNNNHFKKIVSLGSMFFVIQIGLLIINSTNQFLISIIFNGNSVVEYQFYFKFFNIPTMILLLFTQQIWSAVSHAYAADNINWIKKVYKNLVFSVYIGGIFCFISIPFLQKLYTVWLGNNIIIVDYKIALVFAFLTLCDMYIYANSSIANGINKIKCQFSYIIIAAIMKIPVTFLFSQIYESWSSVVIAHIVILLPFVIIQPIILEKQLNKKCLTYAV